MKKKNKTILLALVCLLGLTCLASASVTTKTLEAEYKDIKIQLNGQPITPKDAKGKAVDPFIVDGTTYLPVRAISEALGLQVEWDPASNTVKLTGTASGGPSVPVSSSLYCQDFSVPTLDSIIGPDALLSSTRKEADGGTTGSVMYRYDTEKIKVEDYLLQYRRLLEKSGFEKDFNSPLPFTYVNPVSSIVVCADENDNGVLSVLVTLLTEFDPNEARLMATAYDIAVNIHLGCFVAATSADLPADESFDNSLIDALATHAYRFDYSDHDYSDTTSTAFSYVAKQLELADKILDSYIDCKFSAQSSAPFRTLNSLSSDEIDQFQESRDFIYSYFENIG